MSRDIFVQDIPVLIRSVEDIADGWVPEPLPFGHATLVEALLATAPDADISDPESMHVTLPGADIEVACARETPLSSFAVHVRASDDQVADAFVGALLQRLGARAFDPASDTGIFVG